VPADGSGEPRLLVGGQLAVAGYDARGDTLVHVAATATTMRELFAGERQLTDVGRAFVEGRELVAPERFTAVSADGTEIDAWLVRPAGFALGTKVPVVLNIHGGPYSQYGTGFFDEFQVRPEPDTPSSTRIHAARRAAARRSRARSWVRSQAAPGGGPSTTKT